MKGLGIEGLLVSFFLSFFLGGCSGNRPSSLGVKDSRLSPCPSSPNCVSSQSGDERHKIDPIRFTSNPVEAMHKLKRIIRGMKRATVIQATPDYLYVEFRTLLGFVDDAEFYIDESQKVIHLRSASRIGYWDLGVNRRRVEAIRAEFGGK